MGAPDTALHLGMEGGGMLKKTAPCTSVPHQSAQQGVLLRNIPTSLSLSLQGR